MKVDIADIQGTLPYTPTPLVAESQLKTLKPLAACVLIEVSEKDRLLAAEKALRAIQDMVQYVFDEGDIREPSERGVIALAGKILQEANAGLGQ